MATTENNYTTSNTSTTDFAFTFPYLKEADVKVDVAGVTQSTTAYSFHNATTIRLDTAPSSGVVVRVYRYTDDSGLVSTFYPGSAIRSAELNDNYTQNLYSTQENTNDATDALNNSRVLESGAYVSAITKAAAAVTTANTASTNASSAVTTANTASTNASAAVTTANTASTTATSAVTTANAATTTANAATTTANSAATDAATAISTANTASTNATSAVSTANTASTTATSAASDATSAVSTANTASTNATNAVNTANAASAAVAAAVLYSPKADKAALEATEPTEDGYYEVASSLNIANGTWTTNSVTYTLSGMTITGSAGLTIRLAYTHSSKTYAYSSYFANDPEDRYMAEPAGGNANEVLTTNGSGVLSWEVGGNVTIDAGNFDTGASLVSTTVTYDGGEFT